MRSFALALALVMLASGGALGCREQGPAERAGEAIDEAADLNRRAKERAARQTTIQGTRKKQMERLHAAAAQHCDRADEQRDLLEAVERAARGKTSLP